MQLDVALHLCTVKVLARLVWFAPPIAKRLLPGAN